MGSQIFAFLLIKKNYFHCITDTLRNHFKIKIIHICDNTYLPRYMAAHVSTSHWWQDTAYMFVLAVDVSHSPAKPIMSSPVDSWLKKRGWPEKRIESNLNSTDIAQVLNLNHPPFLTQITGENTCSSFQSKSYLSGDR